MTRRSDGLVMILAAPFLGAMIVVVAVYDGVCTLLGKRTMGEYRPVPQRRTTTVADIEGRV